MTSPPVTIAPSPIGRGRLVARREGAITVLSHAHASAPLRFVRTDFQRGTACAVCVLTFGGGLVDGDTIDVDVKVEPGATLMLFTQATTKAFRGTTRQSIRADVDGGTLLVLCDPVACFAGARYDQTTDIVLHGEGSCVVLDGFTAGRVAYGDRWSFDRLSLATRVERDGRVLLRDALVLDAMHGAIDARMDRFEAFATVTAIGARVKPLTSSILAPPENGHDHVAAPSALPGSRGAASHGAMVRIAARSLASLTQQVQKRVRNLPEIDAVDPFSVRS